MNTHQLREHFDHASDFLTEGRSLSLAGKPGRGKTYLAIAIAYRVIQNGFDAFFTTAAALIADLSAAFRAGELAHALPPYTHPAHVNLVEALKEDLDQDADVVRISETHNAVCRAADRAYRLWRQPGLQVPRPNQSSSSASARFFQESFAVLVPIQN